MSVVVGTQDVEVVGPKGGLEISSPCSSANRISSHLGPTTDDGSTDSSSIGVVEEDSEEEEEVGSSLSLDALEECLPIKKGLSDCYAGRSKSFGNLADVKSVNEMAKEENPFNKRRRNLLAYKLSSSSSLCSSPAKRSTTMMQGKDRSLFYGHGNPFSMPLLPVDEDDDSDDEDRQEDLYIKMGMP